MCFVGSSKKNWKKLNEECDFVDEKARKEEQAEHKRRKRSKRGEKDANEG